jgi:hypothetical protein
MRISEQERRLQRGHVRLRGLRSIWKFETISAVVFLDPRGALDRPTLGRLGKAYTAQDRPQVVSSNFLRHLSLRIPPSKEALRRVNDPLNLGPQEITSIDRCTDDLSSAIAE